MRFATISKQTLRMSDCPLVTAAEFLKRFIDKTESWVHLDIAGVSDVGMESNIAQKGCSTAFGVKLLNQFVADNLE